MPGINVSAPLQPFTSILWGLDYVPIVSAGKACVDYFAIRCWNPGNFDQSSPYAKAYFDHLVEKEDSRYIAVIPAIGNTIVFIQDCYNAVIKLQEQYVLKNAEQGDSNAIEKLYQGSPEQKAKALECYYKAALQPSLGNGSSARNILLKIVCGKEGEEKKKVLAWLLQNVKIFPAYSRDKIYNTSDLPQELRTKIVDVEMEEMLSGKSSSKYALYNFLKIVSIQDRTRAMAVLTKSAEIGNTHAFSYIKIELVFDRSPTSPYFQWIIKHAENLSSPINLSAWKLLKDQFYTSQRESVIASYLRMLQLPQLPRDRLTEIVRALDTRALIGTPEEKAKVLAGYLKAAESGNVKVMSKVAVMYQRAGQESRAMTWFEKAAHAGHVSSILALAKMSVNRGDINTAASWLAKAKGRCHSPMKSFRYNLIDTWIKARRFNPGGGFRYRTGPENDDFQEARRKAEQEQARAERNRSQGRQAEAAAIKVELVKVFGEFSSQPELLQKWRRWCLKAHPDKGGPEAEFKRVTDLCDVYKDIMGWPK